MVGAGSVGERKPVGRVQPILILPRCCYDEVAEPVHRSAASAGHMGDDAVEDLAAVLVRVEPAVDEIANSAARLGPTPGDDARRRVPLPSQRVGFASVVPQE